MSPSNEQIRAELKQILASNQFRQSERLQSFLNYIVEEALEGRGDRLKAYSIGLEVFNRNGVDDALVRATAVRLREALVRYYASHGIDDEVMISIPKGKYIPNFSFRRTDPIAEKEIISEEISNYGASYRHNVSRRKIEISIISIFILIFSSLIMMSVNNDGNDKIKKIFIVVDKIKSYHDNIESDAPEHFRQWLISELVNIGTANIVDRSSSDSNQDSDADDLDPDRTGSVLLLSTVMDSSIQGYTVAWKLSDMRSHVTVWGEETHADGTTDVAARKLADVVAFKLLGVNGTMSILGEHPNYTSNDAYRCIPQSQRIAIYYDDTFQRDVISCLERAVQGHPDEAILWALLAQLYSYGAELQPSLGQSSAPWRDKARMAAANAVRLSPRSYMTKMAQLIVTFQDKQTAAFVNLEREMLTRYPGDPHLKIRVGTRLVRIGHFEEGRRLIEEGIAITGNETPWHCLALAFSYVGERSYEEALKALERLGSLEYYLAPLLKTVALVELGRQDEAVMERERLLVMSPRYPEFVYADAEARGLSAEITARIITDLRKAGLIIPTIGGS